MKCNFSIMMILFMMMIMIMMMMFMMIIMLFMVMIMMMIMIMMMVILICRRVRRFIRQASCNGNIRSINTCDSTFIFGL
jgi:uncharacterized membrane protein YqiK